MFALPPTLRPRAGSQGSGPDECWARAEQRCRARRGPLEIYARSLRRVVETDQPAIVESDAEAPP